MALNYDPKLRTALPANNDSDVVLNRNFRQWAGYLEENLNKRLPVDGHSYQFDSAKILLEECRKHVVAHKRNATGENIIMLTHPFYLQLSHMHHLANDNVRAESDAYVNKLMGLLQMKRDTSSVEIVAVETLHHYAAATSLLLEKGLIDDVVFTEYDSGSALDDLELTRFRYHSVYFGGGYNKRCLSSAIDNLHEVASPVEISAIRDIVLCSPQDRYDTLKSTRVIGLDQSQVVSLDTVVKRLKLK
jgi:hypothetical protein